MSDTTAGIRRVRVMGGTQLRPRAFSMVLYCAFWYIR